jgi:bifunctional DNase/RNase
MSGPDYQLLVRVRVTELTESTFYAQAVLSDETSIDARPSDALTLALVNDGPIYVDAAVFEQAKQTGIRHGDLIQEAEATDDA